MVRWIDVIVAAALLALLAATPADAQRLKGTAVLVPNPSGELLSSTVKFILPRSAWIAGAWFIIPDAELVGEHECTIIGSEARNLITQEAPTGNMKIYARLNRGKSLGSVFRAEVAIDPENSLYWAGCDGDPETIDKFQGSLSAIFASPALYLGLALDSATGNSAGLRAEEEIRDFFGISEVRQSIVPKLIEFHGPELDNRGGSATGVGSARIALRFDP